MQHHERDCDGQGVRVCSMGEVARSVRRRAAPAGEAGCGTGDSANLVLGASVNGCAQVETQRISQLYSSLRIHFEHDPIFEGMTKAGRWDDDCIQALLTMPGRWLPYDYKPGASMTRYIDKEGKMRMRDVANSNLCMNLSKACC